MDPESSSGDQKDVSKDRISLSLESIDKSPRDIEANPKIFFAPDPREKFKHDDFTILPLARTFSRNSYSAASETESARLRKVATGKTVDPYARFPTGKPLR